MTTHATNTLAHVFDGLNLSESRRSSTTSTHGFLATPPSFYDARTPVNSHTFSQHDREVDPFARSFGQFLQTGDSPSSASRPQRPFSTERMSLSIADVSRNSSLTSNTSFAPRTRARIDAVKTTAKALQAATSSTRPSIGSGDDSSDSNTSATSLQQSTSTKQQSIPSRNCK